MGATGSFSCATDESGPNACSSASHECNAVINSGTRSGALGEQECANIGLVLSTVRGDLEGVTRSLEMGANPDTTMDLRIKLGEAAPKNVGEHTECLTPLMRACGLGHEDVVKCLLEARACTEYRDPSGWTPLCHALGNGEVEIAQFLVENTVTAKKQHKELVHKLRTQLIDMCEATVGPEASQAVCRLFEPPGILAELEPDDKYVS